MNQSNKRKKRTLILPFKKEGYSEFINDAKKVRAFIDEIIIEYPELLPTETARGFLMKDTRKSAKPQIIVRRVKIAGVDRTILPSFVMPYMTGFTENLEKPLFLGKFGVPHWALAYVFDRSPMFWYNLNKSIGGHSVLSATVRKPDSLPAHLAADEKHTRLLGEKAYIATVVAEDCFLDARVRRSADTEELTEAYGKLKREAEIINPEYSLESVNTDGWKATVKSWKKLFPAISVIICFLHIFIGIRNRCKKKYKHIFPDVASGLWECYRADNKRSFSQRVRRFSEWLRKIKAPSLITKKIRKLRENLSFYSRAYDHEGCHRTSNMIDRLMHMMDRHLFSSKYFHGTQASAESSIRSRALIYNFAPSNPGTLKKHNSFKSPAERLNRFSYSECWLENLLISASAGRLRSHSP